MDTFLHRKASGSNTLHAARRIRGQVWGVFASLLRGPACCLRTLKDDWKGAAGASLGLSSLGDRFLYRQTNEHHLYLVDFPQRIKLLLILLNGVSDSDDYEIFCIPRIRILGPIKAPGSDSFFISNHKFIVHGP